MRTFTPLLLVIVVVVAVLGMPLVLMGPMHQEMGCPWGMGQTAICATSVLAHIQHWQAVFSIILVELLAVAALTIFAFRHWQLSVLPNRSFQRIRYRNSTPNRPTLLQELFAQGILHPKSF